MISSCIYICTSRASTHANIWHTACTLHSHVHVCNVILRDTQYTPCMVLVWSTPMQYEEVQYMARMPLDRLHVHHWYQQPDPCICTYSSMPYWACVPKNEHPQDRMPLDALDEKMRFHGYCMWCPSYMPILHDSSMILPADQFNITRWTICKPLFPTVSCHVSVGPADASTWMNSDQHQWGTSLSSPIEL
jgi:hypothetical protein